MSQLNTIVHMLVFLTCFSKGAFETKLYTSEKNIKTALSELMPVHYKSSYLKSCHI
jgi:hypothetical protein